MDCSVSLVSPFTLLTSAQGPNKAQTPAQIGSHTNQAILTAETACVRMIKTQIEYCTQSGEIQMDSTMQYYDAVAAITFVSQQLAALFICRVYRPALLLLYLANPWQPMAGWPVAIRSSSFHRKARRVRPSAAVTSVSEREQSSRRKSSREMTVTSSARQSRGMLRSPFTASFRQGHRLQSLRSVAVCQPSEPGAGHREDRRRSSHVHKHGLLSVSTKEIN